MRDKHDVYFVPGLNRGLRLLEIIAESDRPLNVSEIARALDVTRSSAFRYVYTLKDMGFLETAHSSTTYALGPRVLNIGFAFLNSQSIISLARPELEGLRNVTDVSAHLAIRDGKDVLYLDCVQTKSDFVSNINIGSRRPCYASPLGWLLLISLSDEEILTLHEDTPMKPITDKTPTSAKELLAKVREAQKLGYVVSHGFLESGGSSVNAPIRDQKGDVVAAIDISGPDGAFDISKLDGFYLEEVVKSANKISAKLGFVAECRPTDQSEGHRRR